MVCMVRAGFKQYLNKMMIQFYMIFKMGSFSGVYRAKTGEYCLLAEKGTYHKDGCFRNQGEVAE